jgi:hypothetical protein
MTGIRRGALWGVFSLVVLGFTSRAQATAIVNGSTSNVSVSGTTAGAWADGYDGLNGGIGGTFSTDLISFRNGSASSQAISISSIPYVSVGGFNYFVFVLDANEIAGRDTVVISHITITTGANVAYSTTESIALNGRPGDQTLTPGGGGNDMAIYIPVLAFDSFQLHGLDMIVFSATHSLTGGQPEIWRLTNQGVPYTTKFFGSSDPISRLATPEPGTIATTVLGLGLLVWRSRKRLQTTIPE